MRYPLLTGFRLLKFVAVSVYMYVNIYTHIHVSITCTYKDHVTK